MCEKQTSGVELELGELGPCSHWLLKEEQNPTTAYPRAIAAQVRET